jgi:hypothetical protein
MGFKLNTVVPWGRSFDEYLSMFALFKDDLKKKILGCEDGPSSFNAVLTKKGGSIISFDPVYRYSEEKIRKQIDNVYAEVLEQTRHNASQFNWAHIKSVEHLGQIRKTAMEEFLSDFPTGQSAGRYMDSSLPKIPFGDNAFELALCSHFLFLYSEQFSLSFHVKSIKELCRVASEVRIFPLLDLNSIKSAHLEPALNLLQEEGYLVKIETVTYEFQKGGNQMLKVGKPGTKFPEK